MIIWRHETHISPLLHIVGVSGDEAQLTWHEWHGFQGKGSKSICCQCILWQICPVSSSACCLSGTGTLRWCMRTHKAWNSGQSGRGDAKVFLSLVTFSDAHKIVGTLQIKPGEHSCWLELFKGWQDRQEWIRIFYCDLTQTVRVNAWVKSSPFFSIKWMWTGGCTLTEELPEHNLLLPATWLVTVSRFSCREAWYQEWNW